MTNITIMDLVLLMGLAINFAHLVGTRYKINILERELKIYMHDKIALTKLSELLKEENKQ